MTKKQHLSRGLQSLLGGVIGIEEGRVQGSILSINIENVHPNKQQPRRYFDDEDMLGLAESIKKHGVLQPILVKPSNNGYMIIAGERRWRAAKQIGLKEIPAIVRQANPENILELALIENIQREDLNPIEKAKGFQELISKFELTQEQVANAVGKDRSSITNYLRLLELPREIQEYVSRGTLSMGHARALLAVKGYKLQQSIAERAIKEGLSVREVEAMASKGKKSPPKKNTEMNSSSPIIEDLEDRFRRFFGSKVKITENNGKGKITISFRNNEDFSRIANTLGITL